MIELTRNLMCVCVCVSVKCLLGGVHARMQYLRQHSRIFTRLDVAARASIWTLILVFREKNTTVIKLLKLTLLILKLRHRDSPNFPS